MAQETTVFDIAETAPHMYGEIVRRGTPGNYRYFSTEDDEYIPEALWLELAPHATERINPLEGDNG